jgi:hypothetical protein
MGQHNLGIRMTNKEENNKPKDEIDELTKQLENLKIAKLEKEIKSLKKKVYGTNRKLTRVNKAQFDIRKIICYACRKIGYMSRFCKEISGNKRMNIYNYKDYSE